MDTIFATTVIADISDSTPFYEAMGDDTAQRLIQQQVDRLRMLVLEQGGIIIGQKGDDVLGHFPDPDAAFRATFAMLDPGPDSTLSVHAGVHFGPLIVKDDSIFGETVNLTARLVAAANPAEACFSDAVANRLSADLRAQLRPIGPLRLKGVSAPVEAYSLINSEAEQRTAIHRHTQPGLGADGPATLTGEATLVLSLGDQVWRCREGEKLRIGRAPDCDVVLPQPWVSRLHAVLSLEGGKVTLQDRSSSGTYLRVEGGREIRLRREAVMLAGSGLISPSLSFHHADARPLEFEVLRR